MTLMIIHNEKSATHLWLCLPLAFASRIFLVIACTPSPIWSRTESHCSAETAVFSLTHVTNGSFGHGEAGSLQYFAMHARLSSEDAGWPANPGHWQFGYSPICLHMSSQTTPRFCSPVAGDQRSLKLPK